MADIHIRNVDDAQYRQLKVQAASDGITLKELVMRRCFPDDPLNYKTAAPKAKPASSPATSVNPRPTHQPGCKCMMCRPTK